MPKQLSPARRRAREREIYARFLRGQTVEQIARQTDTLEHLVPRAIKKGEEATAKEFADPQQMRLRQTEQLLEIYAEAIAAWEESKKGAEVTKISTAADGEEGRRKAEKTTRKQAGDPRFLGQAMGALQDLRRLWRLEPPGPGREDDQSKHEPASIEEDIHWYGNDAHNLAAQTPAAPTSGAAFAGPLQGGGVR